MYGAYGFLTSYTPILLQAHSAYHGIGIVKLMGRSSGFIAMHASLASGQVDICLIPEVGMPRSDLLIICVNFFWA